MDPIPRGFVMASVVWLLAGTALGVLLAFPAWASAIGVMSDGLIPAHAHLQLFGFVAMMIFGVALHVLPRFEGRPLRWPALLVLQFVLANGGLLLFAGGQLTRSANAVGVGALLMALAVVLFVSQVAGLLMGRQADARL